jgi:hypothetical protein
MLTHTKFWRESLRKCHRHRLIMGCEDNIRIDPGQAELVQDHVKW